MATTKQKLGTAGEELVAKHARCPGCKRTDKSFKLLPPNFKCADLVCDFCGYLAQVKSKRIKGELPDTITGTILGAAWGSQRERMEAGIYFSLYVVLVNEVGQASIYFLPRDLQTAEMFVPPEASRPGGSARRVAGLYDRHGQGLGRRRPHLRRRRRGVRSPRMTRECGVHIFVDQGRLILGESQPAVRLTAR